MSHILAIDQGTTSSRAIVFDATPRASSPRRRRSSRSTSRSRAGSSTIRTTSGRRSPPPAAARSSAPGIGAGAHRRDRHHQPARDHAGLGARHRRAARPRHRLAGPAHQRALRRAARRRATRTMVTERDRPAARPLFLRHQAQVAARRPRGRARAGAARRAPVRHRRQLPDLEADRRAVARHRRHQRRADAALQHPRRRLGPGDLRAPRRPAWRCCPRCATAPPTSASPAPTSSAARVPILGVAGDQQAATVGQACFAPGMLKSTYGTGCFAVLNTGDAPVASRNRLLTTLAYQLDGKPTYALEGSIFIAGAVVQWLRDGLKIIRQRRRDPGAGRGGRPGAAALPGAGLHRPRRALLGPGLPRRDLRPDPQLRAGRVRPRRARERRLPDPRPRRGDARRLAGRRGDTVLRVDGGMTANDWVLQGLADTLGAPVDRPQVLETTALGAAWLAGMRAGVCIRDRTNSPAPGRSTAASSRRWRPRSARSGTPAGATRCGGR